jgi:hypothetical protein
MHFFTLKISEKVHLVGFSTLANNYRTVHGMYNINTNIKML